LVKIKKNIGLLVGVVFLAAIGGLLAYVLLSSDERGAPRYFIVGFEPMTADVLAERVDAVAPEMLLAVYDAFEETGEEAIYDRLATVAAGDALEALYLERVGAMVGGGLEGTEAVDQEIHKMQMLRIDSDRDGQSFSWDARWRVVGTVGHDAHMHVRGNIYSAVLSVAPVDGAWRITEFELNDVDRSEAGQVVEGEP
jgi:hypothetical protein